MRGLIDKDETMTRIRRMQIALGKKKEWISLLSAKAPNTHRVISEDGDEFEFVSNDQEPLEAQIGRLLEKRGAVAASNQ